MSLSVSVAQDGLSKAMRKMVEKMPGIGDVLVRKVAFDIVAAVAELVPVDTGRYRAGWRVSLDVLASGEGAESDTVSVFGSGDSLGVEVTNPIAYGPYIEYGTASRPPGNHLALAMDHVRRRLVYGRGANSLTEQVKRAWQEST